MDDMDERVGVERILKECLEKREKKVSNDILKKQSGRVREVLEKYNEIIAKVEELVKYGIWVCGENGKGRRAEGEEGRRKYREIFERIEEMWKEIEEYLPLLNEKEILSLVRRVKRESAKFDRCVVVARVLSKYEKAITFKEIKEGVRDKDSFKVEGSSMNKILSRTLEYLIDACLVLKCGRRTIKGNLADTYYFRLFRLEKLKEEKCDKCALAERILKVLKEHWEK